MSQKSENQENNPFKGELLVYKTENGLVKLDVHLHNETVWLTQAYMAELFRVQPQNITIHLKNIYEDGELQEEATCKEFLQVQLEGTRKVERRRKFYNLDAIISVGYRVHSKIATNFRIWATQRLNEYIVKGFTMNDERLKEPGNNRYFEELLARIRDIRSSEKVFWRKVLDIYATSIDYDPKSETTKLFFQQVQNKMHWATHGHTAAELIFERADAKQPNMGMTNFPSNKLLKRDVEIAKNYLNEAELNILNRIVTAYLELAELQALSHESMTMEDWIERLNQFLTMTNRELLTHKGAMSHDSAIKKAHQEFESYRNRLLEEPTKIEKHFIEAEIELKKIEKGKE